MKKSFLIRLILILLTATITIYLMTVISNAASLSISTSKSSVAPGESYTVTVTLSNGAGYVSSGGQTQWLDNSSFSYTKTAGSSGTETISASGVAADYTTEQDQQVSASKTVSIVVPQTSSGGSSSSGGNTSSGNSSSGSTTKKTTTTTAKEETPKSSDSTLKELSIAEGTITPEFNKDIKEYLVTIPYEIEEVNITATANDQKAKVEVTGNKELKEGENIVTISVTAEDGTKTEYLIKVTRKRMPLALQSLVIKYENKNGEIVEIPLNPSFSFDVTEYTLEDLEYWVEKLSIEAIANIEGCTIDIQGADNLQIGENTITITLKANAEQIDTNNEDVENQEETITYTIKVNKNKKPGFFTRMSNWFKGIIGSITTWSGNNNKKITVGALIFCIVGLLGLSIYIVIDYNKYKDIIAKVKKVNELNNSEIIEETAQSVENDASDNLVEDRIEVEEIQEQEAKVKEGKRQGKRFK